MGYRLRTKFLAFPAIFLVVSLVLSFAALTVLRSESRLREDFSRDLTQNAKSTILFDQLSRNHTAIHNLLTDAQDGLEEGTVYEQALPLLAVSGRSSRRSRSWAPPSGSAPRSRACTPRWSPRFARTSSPPPSRSSA